jgi:hypothetical protein
LSGGCHHMLKHVNSSGVTHATSLTEAVDWIVRYPATASAAAKPSRAPAVTSPSSPPLRRSPRLSPPPGALGSAGAQVPAGAEVQAGEVQLPPCILSALRFSWSNTGVLLASAEHIPPRPLSHFMSLLLSLHTLLPAPRFHLPYLRVVR